MNEYKSEFKIDPRDEDYAMLAITDNIGNFGHWLLKRLKNDYYIVSFIKGKINNTEFRGDDEYKTHIVKSGRGRSPVGALEEMRKMNAEAYRMYDKY